MTELGRVQSSRMDSYGTPTGWFADLSDDEDRDERNPWQPFLQASGGCFPLPLWFQTEAACQDWIRAHVIGNGWLVNHIRDYGEQATDV